jgi:hypothetical protein
MFFHHSTGECIWGPNGSSTSVPQEMARYNTLHGYYGQFTVTLNENWFPVNYDNEWSTWHSIFGTNSPENISSYFSNYRIIMVKSCFPSSAIEEIGQPIDTLSPEYKTVYNYKWHWRNILSVMKAHPQNFFVIWTNAPLTQEETNPASAVLSKQFCKWAKDTLANGLDPLFGAFPQNAYVFDFFSKLTNSNGYMLPQYANGPNDPHPNALATALIAPLLVNEVFDRSIYYESVIGIKKLEELVADNFHLCQNYPNPFNPSTKIKFSIPNGSATIMNMGQVHASMSSLTRGGSLTTLKIYDLLGREVATLVNEKLSPGTYEIEFDGNNYSSGVYLYKLISDNFIETKKMILIK